MKQRMIAAALAAILLLGLAACGKAPQEVPETTVTPTTVPATTAAPATVPPTTEAPTTEAPTEPAPVILNPLNGGSSPMEHRAIAAVINNHPNALPHRGTSKADIIFEFLADNCAITRMLAVFSDITQVDDLGPIRSARPYTLSTARSLDALYIHFGGSAEADELIYAYDWDDMNGIVYDGVYFYRDRNRINSGYGYEHTAFTTSEDIMDYISAKGVRYEQEQAPDYGFLFDDGIMDGDSATDICVQFGYLDKRTYFEYDSDTGRYDAYEYGDAFYDEAADTDLSFRNVVILETSGYAHENSVHFVYELISSGDATLCRDGAQVAIRWYRNSLDDTYHFTYQDGTPVSFGVGNTYIGVVPLDNRCTID